MVDDKSMPSACELFFKNEATGFLGWRVLTHRAILVFGRASFVRCYFLRGLRGVDGHPDARKFTMRQENRWEVERFEEDAPGGRDGGAVLHDGLLEIRICCDVEVGRRASRYEDGGEGNRGGGDLSLMAFPWSVIAKPAARPSLCQSCREPPFPRDTLQSNGPVAQLVEQPPTKRMGGGSSPLRY